MEVETIVLLAALPL